jgi:hypothetical protein
MWNILKYVRHVTARSARNARHGNIPVTILFFRSVSTLDSVPNLQTKLIYIHRIIYFALNHLLRTRYSCLVVLLRALSGAGFNPDRELAVSLSQHGSSQETLPLRAWRAKSQERLEKEWARLSNSGMLIWEDVVRREKAWQQNWVTPAMEALHNRRMRYLGGVAGEDGERDEMDEVLIGEDRGQHEAPVDEDEDLFAPEHEYIERPPPVLNKKTDSTTAPANVAASTTIGDVKAPRKKRQLYSSPQPNVAVSFG